LLLQHVVSVIQSAVLNQYFPNLKNGLSPNINKNDVILPEVFPNHVYDSKHRIGGFSVTHKTQEYYYDSALAFECVDVFSMSVGVGCAVLGVDGEILYESGPGAKLCGVCAAAGMKKSRCHNLDSYGMLGKCLFGEKYFSFCGGGLCFFSSPVFSRTGEVVLISAGPFLMENIEENIIFNLKQKMPPKDARIDQVTKLIASIPNLTSTKVNVVSSMLSLTAAFIRGKLPSAEPDEAKTPIDYDMESAAASQIPEQSEVTQLSEYPVKTEKRLLASIAESDRPKAQMLLNQLLGHILFSSGGDFDRIKSEMYELLVMISRGAIDVGVSAGKALGINRRFWREAHSLKDMEELCLLLSGVINQYIDCIFSLTHKRSFEDIDKAVKYMWKNYSSKITLEDVAKTVFLSPTHFCKIFQERKGCGFNAYLNRIRIEKSKQLLLQYDLRIADIVSMVGFEDQSYFTKVFKRFAGVSPTHFRKCYEENAASA
jgi:AraC-like DNA-binding protein/ligand-binding sensor protein